MISTDRIDLRPFDRTYAEKTREWMNDQEYSLLLDRVFPISDLEHEHWLASLHENKNCVFWAIVLKSNGRHIGNIWLWDIDWRHRKAEIRIVLGDKENTEQGIGTEALELISQYAIKRLNLHKLYAFVLSKNPRARRAFEKANFNIEGELKTDRWMNGEYVDVYLLGRIHDEI